MRNIYILFDCPDEDNDKQWLYDGLSDKYRDGNVISVSIKHNLWKLSKSGIVGKIRSRIITIQQAYRAVTRCKKDDVIICWEHLSSLYVNSFSQMLKKKSNIIGYNWLSPDKKPGKFFRMQKNAVRNNNFKVIVNAANSPDDWNNLLGINNTIEKYFYIPDVYDVTTEFQDASVKGDYCFTGGINNRNWKFLIELAKELGNIQFVCIAEKEDFIRQVDEVPPNVQVLFDVNPEKYYKCMRNAYIVLMPLIENKPSGLINIIKAAQYGIPCLSSKTDATSVYYEDAGMLLNNDLEIWKNELLLWFSYSLEDYKRRTNCFSYYIKDNFSPDKAISDIISIINDIRE